MMIKEQLFEDLYDKLPDVGNFVIFGACATGEKILNDLKIYKPLTKVIGFIDNDNDAPYKTERKKKLESIFKDNYYELKVREIENTISKNVLDKMLFGDSEVAYKKQFNQRDYMNKKVYMGKFIDEHYKLSRKYSSAKGTGTIKDKLNFSKRIANTIENYKDLSTKAIDLCEKIAIFIEKSNKSDI